MTLIKFKNVQSQLNLYNLKTTKLWRFSVDSKKAFTLIEVMVVLSILAIIAILAYNFFGGTMKEAAQKQRLTKVYNDMRSLSDAMDLLVIKDPAANILSGNRNNTLISEMVVKSIPSPPAGIEAGVPKYGTWFQYDDIDNDGDGDEGAVELSNVSLEFCNLWNTEHTDLTQPWDYGQGTGEPTPYAPPQTYPTYCQLAGAAYSILWLNSIDNP